MLRTIQCFIKANGALLAKCKLQIANCKESESEIVQLFRLGKSIPKGCCGTYAGTSVHQLPASNVMVIFDWHMKSKVVDEEHKMRRKFPHSNSFTIPSISSFLQSLVPPHLRPLFPRAKQLIVQIFQVVRTKRTSTKCFPSDSDFHLRRDKLLSH